MAEKDLQLYVKNGCPYCHKVLSFMDTNGIVLPLHNIDESAADRDYLVEVGGKRQVPCLFIDGKAMYESDDIIAYLGKEFSAASAGEENEAPSAGASCTIGGGCSF
ncbi:MAG: glutaredoxin [Olsenella sp.]|jgi:glutaredoxin|nr:glutaredoxin [Olsenella sp.]